MNKEDWFDRSKALCNMFSSPIANTNTQITITFGSSNNPRYIGREAFQNIYDLVSSWPCWDIENPSSWQTQATFEVGKSHIASGAKLDQPGVKHFVKTDEQGVKVECVSLKHNEQVLPILLKLHYSPTPKEIDRVEIDSVYCNHDLFRLKSSASFTGIEVTKTMSFELKTHFEWKYQFSLVWSFPFTEDRENPDASLIFKTEPKCRFAIICNPIVDSNVPWQHLAESMLLKIHECVPNIYRSPEGGSVSLLDTSDGGSS